MLVLTLIGGHAMALTHLEIEAFAALQLVPVVSLRRWLRGSWGLLFSHPDDFARYDFETDRWLQQVRDAFATAWVRPLALASEAGTCGGAWIRGIGGGAAATFAVQLDEYPISRTAPERRLQTAVQSAESRFVMIVDNSLQLHRTLLYSAADALPSPITLASTVARYARGWCKLLSSQSPQGNGHGQGT
jgi:hypothetical protein